MWVLLIYLPFGGTVTYWIGGGNPFFQFAKDFLYFPALISLIISHRQQQLPRFISKPLMLSLGLLLGFSLLTLIFVNGYQQFFEPPTNGQPLMMGILGLKVLVGYIPLIGCGYYLIRDRQELFVFNRLLVTITLICCILSLAQYELLATGICEGTRGLQGDDLFKGTLDAKCLVGGSLVFSPSQNLVRLPGTFVSPWQWNWFLISSAFFTATAALFDPSKKWRIVSFTAIFLVLLAAIVSGQKLALVFLPLILIILFLATRNHWKKSKRLISVAIFLGVWVAIAPWIITFLAGGNETSQFSLVAEQFANVSNDNLGLLGNGLGRATNAARIFGKTMLIETFYPKLLYEIGYPGLLAFLGVVTVLCWVTFKGWRSLSDTTLRRYGFSFWLFIVLVSYNTYYYPLDADPVNIYYWFLAGVILKLPSIEK
ncbi:MAG: hypothetical protein F6K35_39775 [Okeania sp. SIO2H7]|nr:hypothetical protein [Okeania sp. SIO2H7]